MARKQAKRKLQSGRYEIDNPIPGGMGTVFEAIDTHGNEKVAIKRHDRGDPDRFRRECQLICDPTLRSHRHSAAVVIGKSYFSEGGSDYLVMEFVDGVRLDQEQFRRIPLRKALLITDNLLNGVEYLHSINCVHRDIKPSNLIYPRTATSPYFVKLVDLGTARFPDSLPGTSVGMGTPSYSAPECLTNPRIIGGWSDMFSVGAVLFHLLTGISPCFELLWDPIRCRRDFDRFTDPASPYDTLDLCELRPEIPVQIGDLVRSALSKDHTQRPQSVDKFRQAYLPVLNDLIRLRQHRKYIETVRTSLTLRLLDTKREERSLPAIDNLNSLAADASKLLGMTRREIGSPDKLLNDWGLLPPPNESVRMKDLALQCMHGLQLLSQTNQPTAKSTDLEKALRAGEAIVRSLLVLELMLLPTLHLLG